MSAYQRWELNSLDETAGGGSARPGVPLPTAEEVENIQQTGHQEGYAAGYQEGKAQGRGRAGAIGATDVGIWMARCSQFDEDLTQNLLVPVAGCRQANVA